MILTNGLVPWLYPSPTMPGFSSRGDRYRTPILGAVPTHLHSQESHRRRDIFGLRTPSL